MPTFHDPLADAAEASEALRGLAHASRVFDDPAHTYTVFGDVVASVRSLRQILDQLAAVHLAHQGRAHDDSGDHTTGVADARAAVEALRRASALIDQSEDQASAAFAHSGRIAWHREPTPDPAPAPGRERWVSVVFLQGEEADDLLDVIDQDGASAAIEQLKQWDYGEETTSAALSNGHVYDQPTAGPSGRIVTEGDYALTYDHAHGQISLLRRHTVAAADALPGAGIPAPGQTAMAVPAEPPPASPRPRRAHDPSWFEHPGVAAVKQSRGLSR